MKKIRWFALLIIIVAVAVSAGCTKKDDRVSNINKAVPTPTPTSIPTPVPKPDPNDAVIAPLPPEVVKAYMKNTLGTIPGAEVDYDKAKQYLSDELNKEFTSPMFVPTSYCIQDGPDDVKIHEEEMGPSAVNVKVSAEYGGEMQEMWNFELKPSEKDGQDWEISKIECLNLLKMN